MKYIITLVCFIISCSVIAQQKDSSFLKGYSIGTHYGFIFAHSEDVQNTAGANPFGVELIYSKQNITEKTWQQCNCFLNTGVGVNYFNFDNDVLGKAASVFYIFEPQFKLTSKTKFLLDAFGGLSYLTNPYDKNTNPNNRSYSLPVSIYVGLGVGLQYAFAKQWQIGFTGNYLHISNGGIKDPNKGINWPTANLRLTYNPTTNQLPDFRKKNTVYSKQKRFDIGVFMSSKTTAIGQKERFLIYGVNANYSRQVGRINALTFGNELIIDNALKENLRRDGSNKSNIRYGLTFGHEFLLGNFIFSQQLGYYAFNESTYFSNFYHRWGLLYKTKSNLNLGINLLAHAQVANFIDFRV
ncbi:MAG: acyloxyacyl hydrolase, partial [Bacteroidia bacterium]|nr:acyloxyacyl hydrolase [Bacteroidia bacterium]